MADPTTSSGSEWLNVVLAVTAGLFGGSGGLFAFWKLFLERKKPRADLERSGAETQKLKEEAGSIVSNNFILLIKELRESLEDEMEESRLLREHVKTCERGKRELEEKLSLASRAAFKRKGKIENIEHETPHPDS